MTFRRILRSILIRIIVVITPIILVFIIGEIYFRINPRFVADPSPNPPYDYRVLNDSFGWINKANYQYKGTMSDLAGVTYPINISFDEYGFRANQPHGDPGKKSVLFIGDSYTQAIEVSDDKTFYHLIADSLSLNIYAYGAAGFGTLQEFMILQKYFGTFHPDLVVLQTCTNDFTDNYCRLEKEACYKVGARRPYLDSSGKVYYDHAWLPHKHLRQYSFFLYFLSVKYEDLLNNSSKNERTCFGEQSIAEKDSLYQPFAHSIHVTELILLQLKQYIPASTSLLVFCSDPYDPSYSWLKRLCLKNGINFISEVAQRTDQFQTKESAVHASDGYHWNERGHAIVSSILINEVDSILQRNK